LQRVLGPDVLLSILRFCGEIRGRKRLQKIAYLLKERKDIQVPYKFIPYLYGPYSQGLQMDLSFLCSLGLVDEKHDDFYYTYTLTKEGTAFFRKKVARKTGRTGQKIRESCKEYQKLSTTQLVDLAYKTQGSS
jgi:uncharacterized protein YwgA